VQRVFDNPGISVLGVSVAVSVFTLPLYFRAEKWQETERQIQKRMAPKIAKIKAAFTGDEQYMILSAYYRQNHYHPVYAMRSTFGLLIQIPFFIAAYACLSRLEALRGSSFLFIRDLSAPDALFTAFGAGINILPVAMTVVNCVSGMVYTRGLGVKDKIQIYGAAVVFLALLYNSPSGLVLYWTMNNIISLGKNILVKAGNAGKWIYGLLFTGALFLDVYVLFFHGGYIVKRLVLCAAVSAVFFLPALTRLSAFISRKIRSRAFFHETALGRDSAFLFSVLTMFLLAGLVIPALLIASSVSEFSFTGGNSPPFVYIGLTSLQSAGIFLFWPCCLFFLFKGKTRALINICASLLCAMALVNTFIFPGNYGFLTNTMILSNPGSYRSNLPLIVINIAVLVLTAALVFFLLLTRRRMIYFTLQMIMLMGCFGLGLVNLVKIRGEFSELEKQEPAETLTAVYNLSKTEKNIVVIMLDRAISAYVPYIFAEKQELAASWSGFTWYPNCVSFGPYTLYGVPALTGGYEYTVSEMQDNPKPLVEKHNEAMLLLPLILGEKGFTTAITDPSWSNYSFSPDLSVFEGYPFIQAKNITALYTSHWLNEHPDIKMISIPDILKAKLLCFSFFKMAPPLLRVFIYDRGDWLLMHDRDILEDRNELTVNALGKYAALDYLPRITKLDSGAATYTIIFNELTHDPFFMQAPSYTPSNGITNKGGGPYAGDAHYHVDMAAFILLGKWFDFLKQNNAYNNTRIIIVSDLGWGIPLEGTNNTVLPGGSHSSDYNALLMVKDFDAEGPVKTDCQFMTQADVPLLALEGIADKPRNPFTNNLVETSKKDGATITTSSRFYPTHHGKFKFTIGRHEWLRVRDNIFDPANWERVEK
jgi:YidC/Oxa1 family membrane protein insertase